MLGHRIKPKGEKEGLEVLHILAHHPSTAKFVCTKLAMRFVSDDPPQPLVDRMAQTFLKKDGNIREVLKTMLDSPEFWAPDAYRAKVKTPLEFVVSARARQRSRSNRRHAHRAAASEHGNAALRHAAAYRLFHEGGCLGQFLRAAGTHEFCAGADVQEK